MSNDNVTAIFNNRKKISQKTLNNDSIKINFCHFNKIDEFEDITLLDSNGDKILDSSILVPNDKAYIIFNRIHFGPLYKNKPKEAMKKFIAYLLNENNLNYVTSAIYFDFYGCGIKDYIIEEIGFFPYSNYSCIYAYINSYFRQFIKTTLTDDNIKNSIIHSFDILYEAYNRHLNKIKDKKRDAKIALQLLISENYCNKELIQMKEIDIKHYEQILEVSKNILKEN